MRIEGRLGAGAAAALRLVSLAACGGSKGTSAASGPATSAGTATPTVSASRSTAPKSAATPAATGATPSGSTGSTSCPAGDVGGVVGGKGKCLHAGQECSEKHAADYTQYGFACAQQGQRYILAKK